MSFILDALKKSEAERLRKDAPGISSIPHGGQAASSPRWMWVILALLAINLVVVAGLYYRDEPAPPPEPAPVSTIVRGTDNAPAPTAVAPPPASRAPETADRETIVVVQPAVVPSVTPESLPPVAQNGTVDDGLDTFNDLRAKGVLSLPDMHLDIHVYSGQPADRFVFVNMSKYKEKATLKEGPVVQQITADGVVLSFQGTTFLLPRE